mmetsp:Transcript_37698/g.56942  ORF Transcript_37698/g.56942 Transcript_37698/m.56942 type:complete len:445 (+) Transcript_37698:146-1480(+)
MEIDSFVTKWGLDDSSQILLLQLTDDVQEKVLKHFSPKPGTRDVNRLFHGFVKSQEAKGAGKGSAFGAAPQPQVLTPEDQAMNEGEVLAFVAQWGLDESAQTILLGLPRHTQMRMLTEFQPKPGTRDPNRLFHGFLKSLQNPGAAAGAHGFAPSYGKGGPAVIRPPHLAPRAGKGSIWGAPAAGGGLSQGDLAAIQAFATQWGLDELAHQKLRELPPHSQARVLAEFAPRPGTRDVNRLFHGFLKSMVQPGGGKGGKGAVHQAAHEISISRGMPPDGGPMDSGRVHTFCQTWGLDESSFNAMLALDASVQAQIVRDFSPKAHTNDVNRLFHGFIKSVQMKNGGGMFTAVPPAAPAKRFIPSGTGEPPMPEEISLFIQTWGLDESCSAALEVLPPEVQRQVVDSFSPKPGTRDPKSLFHGYLRSMANGGGKRARAGEDPLFTGFA